MAKTFWIVKVDGRWQTAGDEPSPAKQRNRVSSEAWYRLAKAEQDLLEAISHALVTTNDILFGNVKV